MRIPYKPKSLSDMMTTSQKRPMAQQKVRPDSIYDTAKFRETLKEGKGGNWYTPKGNLFEDGTYNPKTGVRTKSRIIKQ